VIIVNSDGTRVEVDLSLLQWRKSSHSNNGGDCVEVALNLPGLIGIRDSKSPAGSALVCTRVEWPAFVNSVRSGDFGV
jgi:hypothetical protein